jgi:hypothetical protein
LEFCSPPLCSFYLPSVFHRIQKKSNRVAHHVAIIVTPFALPGCPGRIGERASTLYSHIWT